LTFKSAKLCAFGSTRRKGAAAKDDENLQKLLEANTTTAVIFGKAWDLHARDILGVSPEENLAMIADTVAFLRDRGREVIFDAEHFFDGCRANPEYALKVLQTAQNAGAAVLCLCDTNGGTMPVEIFNVTKTVCEKFNKSTIGIHAHDDGGCAAANTLVAVSAGASHIQGTFTGFGERCGNASLSAVIPALKLKYELECDGALPLLKQTAAAVALVANTQIPHSQPYIGKSAFSHKAGMHIDGVIKNSASFEHIPPEAVGNSRRFLVSEVAGRGSVLEKIRPFAPQLTKTSPELGKIIETLKEREHYGYQYESADAGFELLVKKVLGMYTPHFELVFYKTTGEFPSPDGEATASATIKVNVSGQTEVTAALGHGSVNALDLALRKALTVFYPQLAGMSLTDYKVRVLEQKAATAAKVRVLIESAAGGESWTTIGVSEDIIEASLLALADSIEYFLQL
ncbi:MAG: citramalate synthase, partial [Oscillospiraceae bacterium]|jgi:2-isopropylmalate synthase|nr:citramalate synthase [Oscillospiraceae bacterium]